MVPRRPVLGPFDDIPKYWVAQHKMFTVAQTLLSLLIPEGEKFFVRCVSRAKRKVNDQTLLEDIVIFSKQEGHHSKGHIEFNNALRKFDVDVDYYERAMKRVLTIIERFLPVKVCLAMTVFMEHLTAIFSETPFLFPEFCDTWDSKAKDFWIWHSVEELEHKSVAFDVFRAVGGGYLTRIITAVFFIPLLFIFLGVLGVRLLGEYGRHQSQDREISTKELIERCPCVRKQLPLSQLRYLCSYFKPNFHPDNRDHSGFIAQWKLDYKSWDAAI